DDVNSRPNVIDLENRCITKWNTTLEYLVTSSGDINITQSMKLFLLQAGLMQQLDTESLASAGGNKVGLRITSKGYEYMLLDTRQQVWLFALECLKCVAAADLAEVISFLFMLSYCKVGECYPVSALSSAQIKFMSQLCDLGIIFRTHFKATVFYPTRIAVSMSCTAEQAQASVPLVTAVSAASRGTVAVKEAGSSVLAMHIIVETNFQVVAYVKSDLHLHMLRLFVDSHGMIRMPDMAVGHLTRRSIKAALRTGISAAQIISFLEVHAHPLVATRVPIVPENVTDQLFLWEAENVRLKVDDGVCVNLTEIASGEYLDFLFSKLEEYANEIGVCLWSSAAKKSLIITPEGYNQLNLFAETLDAGG
ncbi:GTF2H4, partial [Symbiodinium microadriaticum]